MRSGAMRLREVLYEGKLNLLVYLAEQERNDLNSMMKDWNSKYAGIITFISGDRDIKGVLKQMVTQKAS